jgi:hypothetical protein
VTRSVLLHDQETFLMYRDERLPIITHLLLGALAILLIATLCLVDYHDLCIGIFAVSTVTFGASLYLVVAIELQDPVKSPWFAERIPLEWLTKDVDVYFRLGHKPLVHKKRRRGA